MKKNIGQRHDARRRRFRLFTFQPNQRTLQVNLAPLDLDGLADPYTTIIQKRDERTKMCWQFREQVLELRTDNESLPGGRLFEQSNYGHELNLAVYSRDVEHSTEQRQ